METTAQISSASMHSNRIRIGTAGWSYQDWEGVFYPPDLRHRRIHPVEYFARFFDTAEINTSFFEPLKPEIVKFWCRKVSAVNPNFLFTAKLYRAFTHSPLSITEPTSAASIRPTDEDEAMVREGLDALAGEGRLGALLIQFPLSFKSTSLNREYLDRLLRQFIEYPRVVEVRDSTWDNPETIASFARKNVAFCNIEPVHEISTAYVRLHGRNPGQWFDFDDRNDYLYKENELADWKQRIASIAANAQDTYVIASNHSESKAAVNALQLKAMIAGERVAAPSVLIQKYLELRKFAEPMEDFEQSGPHLPRPA